MRIAHVVRQYYPSVGGFEEVVKNLCKEQKSAGYDPYVVTLNRYFKALDQTLSAYEEIDGIKVIRIPFCGSARYPIAPSVLKHISDADLVHVHAIDFFYDFLALTKVFHRKKLVVTTHGGFFHTRYASTFKKLFFNTVTKFSSTFYHKVIASSENDGEIFKTIIHAGKLVTIENGVDIDKLAIERKTEYPPTLMYFGRWSDNKGIFDTIDFFEGLLKHDHSTVWSLIISGRPYDLNKKDITEYVIQKKLTDFVTITENPTEAELKELTLKATYFISMSKFEGFGIAPIEGMSAGLYPILNAIPPFKRLVGLTGHGVLVSADHDRAITEVMGHYHNQVFDLDAMQSKVANYSWSRVSKEYLLQYE